MVILQCAQFHVHIVRHGNAISLLKRHFSSKPHIKCDVNVFNTWCHCALKGPFVFVIKFQMTDVTLKQWDCFCQSFKVIIVTLKQQPSYLLQVRVAICKRSEKFVGLIWKRKVSINRVYILKTLTYIIVPENLYFHTNRIYFPVLCKSVRYQGFPPNALASAGVMLVFGTRVSHPML